MSAERDDLRDDAVARAWREHVRDTPPQALDDAIRAAAHRAVGAKPRENLRVAEARQPWRWWMPLAAAATIGAVAIGVLQNLPQDASEPTVVSDAVTARRIAPTQPAPDAPRVAESAPEARDRMPLPMPRSEVPALQVPAAQAPAARPVPARPAAKPDAMQQRKDAPAEAKETFAATPPADDRQLADKVAVAPMQKRVQEGETVARKNEQDAASGFVASPPASAPAPAPVLAAALGAGRDSADTLDTTVRAKQRAAEMPARAAAAPAPPAAPTSAAGGRAMVEPQAMAVTPPDVFILEIRRRLAAGDREGAVRELQRFRRTHVDADARLPEDLRAFGAGVPR